MNLKEKLIILIGSGLFIIGLMFNLEFPLFICGWIAGYVACCIIVLLIE